MIGATNKTITIITKTKTGEDDHGNDIEVESSRTVPALVGYGATGTDFGPDRNTMTTQATIFLPNDVTVAEASDFIIDGKKWRQDGEVIKWDTPKGFSLRSGQVISVKKSEG